MALGVASKCILVLPPFLLLRWLVFAGLGCGPAMGTCDALHAAPSAPSTDAVLEDPVLELARGLGSEKAADRKRALKSLVALGSAKAWRQAFVALSDPESEVGDDAQLVFARANDPVILAELAGKAGLGHRDAAVRLRIAEAFGRMTCDVEVAPLLRMVDDREPEVARLALWSIERLASARHLVGDLERGVSTLEHAGRTHRDAGVRAEAICARAAIAARAASGSPLAAPEDFTAFLARCAEDRDPRVRCATAMAARSLPAASSISLMRAFALDPRLEVRLARIETLEILSCKPAVNALIAAFDTENAARARHELVASLQRLSGFKHRDDPRPWRDWAAQLPADWQPTLIPGRDSESGEQRGGTPAGGAGGEGRTSAQVSFVGLPLVSAHICFAIDFSGSMWTPMPDGRLPKELVDARLRATLERLTPATEFNIVPFTNEILPWRPKLVPANPANVRTAIADFEKCQAHGRGNFFDAAVFALLDPEVDTLLTLTDGIPTGGFHSNLDLIVALLLERNRFRRVAFDTVLVDAPSYAIRRWQTLSQFSGGRLVATDKAE